jgi:hypothetical protein
MNKTVSTIIIALLFAAIFDTITCSTNYYDEYDFEENVAMEEETVVEVIPEDEAWRYEWENAKNYPYHQDKPLKGNVFFLVLEKEATCKLLDYTIELANLNQNNIYFKKGYLMMHQSETRAYIIDNLDSGKHTLALLNEFGELASHTIMIRQGANVFYFSEELSKSKKHIFKESKQAIATLMIQSPKEELTINYMENDECRQQFIKINRNGNKTYQVAYSIKKHSDEAIHEFYSFKGDLIGALRAFEKGLTSNTTESDCDEVLEIKVGNKIKTFANQECDKAFYSFSELKQKLGITS